MNWSLSSKAFAGMPRHAVITAAMLSCLSAVAVADSQLSGACCGSVYDGTMARGTTSSTILRVDFAGIPYQILKHQPHVMAGVFTDSLSSEFFYSSVLDLASSPVSTLSYVTFCMSPSPTPTYPSPTHFMPLHAPPQNPILDPDTCISLTALPLGVTNPRSN